MQTSQLVSVTSGHKWLSSPVTSYRGTLDQMEKHIPAFERRTFGPELLPSEQFGEDDLFLKPLPPGFNRNYDVIVRKPLTENEVEIPVGIVSKQYSLIQHYSLLDEAIKAVKIAQIKPEEIKAALDITEYGERMRLRLQFPDSLGFEVKVGDRMSFTLECYNSIDGSLKFMAVVGWLRLLCSNGMVSYESDSNYRRRHNQYLQMNDIATVLQEGIADSTKEQAIYRKWMRTKISEDKLKKWVNKQLADSWGKKAAARAWHITLKGHDVQFIDPFQKGDPTDKDVVPIATVPGAVIPGDNVYAVSQSLSWLAKERRDVQEQLEWKQQIPELLDKLSK